MTYRLLLWLSGIAFQIHLPLAANAQSDEKMAEVFEWKFEMDAPDAGFEAMAGASGWEDAATGAKVICMATPVPYSQMEEDLMAIASEEGQTVLEKSAVEIGGVKGLLILLEFAPVAGEDAEVVYSLMFARPFQDVSLVLNAHYPKAQHDRLYAKMLDAFGTVRKK